MKFHGIDMRGKFHVQRVSTLPVFESADKGRLIYVEDEDEFYFGGTTDWKQGGEANADKVDGYHASQTANPNTIPVADASGKLASDWLPPMEAATVGGYYPSTTPGASKIPVADATGKLAAAWLPNGVPVGTVIFVASSKTPAGYLKANGGAISRTTYASLYSAIGTTFGAGDGSTTFNLPDLRGEFIRGWDDGRGVDASRVFGSWQDSLFGSHRHGDRDWYVYWNDQQSYHGPGSSIPHLTYSGHMYYDNRSASIDLAAGGAETRPRNVALLACIKY